MQVVILSSSCKQELVKKLIEVERKFSITTSIKISDLDMKAKDRKGQPLSIVVNGSTLEDILESEEFKD